MVSIREAVNSLDRVHQMRAQMLESYLATLRDMARYAIELDHSITPAYKRALEDLAAQVASGDDMVLSESRGVLRALLRDYRDQSSAYLGSLKDELSNTARALEEILDSLSRVDGDEEARLKGALKALREISNFPAASAIRGAVLQAANGIDQSLENLRKNQQLTIAQFQIEIRMLHQRIDSLETAAEVDNVTKLLKRTEMEQRIREAIGEFCLVLIRVGGFRAAERAYPKDVAIELAGAFAKRLRNSVPPNSVISRWGHEDFVTMLPASKTEVISIAKWIAEHLSGAYSLLLEGKLIQPALQVSVVVVEGSGGKSDAVFNRIDEFLTGN
jgi:GGDEF domain-containing protein